MLQQEFSSLVYRHSSNAELATKLWKDIAAAYGEAKRTYHNLSHLEQMLTVLQPFQAEVEDWDTLLFALFYHDVVYSIGPHLVESNEGLSAKQAVKALSAISYPADKIERCRRHIVATQKHELSADSDTNLITDADLSILGQPWTTYEDYYKDIRKEYSVYPDIIYQPGRKKVLNHFLDMECIYKTSDFFKRYESQARENISRELEIFKG